MKLSRECIEEKLIQNKQYLSLSAAHGITYLSFSMLTFTEAWFVIDNLNMPNHLGFIMMAATIPRLLLMLVGGVYADKKNRVSILYRSILSRVFLIFVLVGLIFSQYINWGSFLIIVLLVGICDAFYWPASSSILPSIVQKENLTKANSVIQVLSQGSMILGPVLAGILIEKQSIITSFLLSAGLLMIACLLLRGIKDTKTNNIKEEIGASVLIREVLVYIKDSKLLTRLLIGTIFVNLVIVGPLFMGLPIYVKSVLNGNTIDYSLLESLLGVGTLIGAVLIGVINPGKHRGKIILFSLLLGAIFYGLLSISVYMVTASIAIFLLGIMLAGAQIPLISAIQSIVREDLLGRFMSIYNTASLGLVPVSYAVTSLLLTFNIEIQIIMAVGSATLFLVVLSLFMNKQLRSFN